MSMAWRRMAACVVAGILSLALAAACGSFSGEPTAVAADAEADRSIPADQDAPAEGGEDGGADAEDPVAEAVGCSDGKREGFKKNDTGLAACEGAWTVAGLVANAKAECSRRAGNDSLLKKNGEGCAAEDLCARRWHVCRDAKDVLDHGGGGNDLCGSTETDSDTFFATAQPSNGGAACAANDGGFNDILGCGEIPYRPDGTCSPLNAILGFSGAQPTTWAFGVGTDDANERRNVTKAPGPGGVLCCHD